MKKTDHVLRVERNYFGESAVVGIRICLVLNFVEYETRSSFLIPEKKPLLLWTRRRNNSYPSSTNDGALSDLVRCINKYTFCARVSLCTWTSCLTDITVFSPDSVVKSLNLSRNKLWVAIKCLGPNNPALRLHYYLQSNLSNTDTEGTVRSARIREVSV